MLLKNTAHESHYRFVGHRWWKCKLPQDAEELNVRVFVHNPFCTGFENHDWQLQASVMGFWEDPKYFIPYNIRNAVPPLNSIIFRGGTLDFTAFPIYHWLRDVFADPTEEAHGKPNNCFPRPYIVHVWLIWTKNPDFRAQYHDQLHDRCWRPEMSADFASEWGTVLGYRKLHVYKVAKTCYFRMKPHRIKKDDYYFERTSPDGKSVQRKYNGLGVPMFLYGIEMRDVHLGYFDDHKVAECTVGCCVNASISGDQINLDVVQQEKT